MEKLFWNGVRTELWRHICFLFLLFSLLSFSIFQTHSLFSMQIFYLQGCAAENYKLDWIFSILFPLLFLEVFERAAYLVWTMGTELWFHICSLLIFFYRAAFEILLLTKLCNNGLGWTELRYLNSFQHFLITLWIFLNAQLVQYAQLPWW